jgi:HD superfamily phosphohydrolase
MCLIRSTVDPDSGIQLHPTNPFEGVVVKLISAPAIERMKYVSQLSTAAWVYPDGVHTRFPHVVGSAYLTADILGHIHAQSNGALRAQLEEWGPLCVAFAMTHDLGHIAPGSHVAHRVWFDGKPDCHEEMSHKLLREDPGLRCALEQTLGVEGARKLDLVVTEHESVPRWTWQLITAGGWNTDRGDWVPRDSHMCGVSYGAYEVPIIKKNLMITAEGDLAIREPGVSALEAFFGARFDMYRNVYYHPTARIGAEMHALVGKRARELFQHGKLGFADETMQSVLSASSGAMLTVPTIMNMVEAWWQYHLIQWTHENDTTLRELSGRLLRREPYKRFKNHPELEKELRGRAERMGLDPAYFVLAVPGSTVKLHKDLETAIKVYTSDGSVQSLVEYSPLMNAFSMLRTLNVPAFIAAPQDILSGFTAH